MLDSRSKSFIVLLGSMSALTAMSIDMSLPSLPLLTQVMHTSAAKAQMTLGSFLLGFAVAQLVFGPLSDRFGRKKPLIAGLVLFVLAGIGCTVAQTIDQLIVLRFLHGAGACAGRVMATAIVRDLFDRRDGTRMLSYMTTVTAMAPLIAPTIGGLLMDVASWRAIYGLTSVAGVLVLVAIVLLLGESATRRDPDAVRLKPMLRNCRRFFGNREVMGHTLVNAFVFSALFSYVSGSPFVLIDVLGVPQSLFGVFFAMTAAALMAGATVNAKVVHRLSHVTILRAGLTLCLVAALALVGLDRLHLAGGAGIAVLVGPMVAFVFSIGFVLPNAVAAAMEPVADMAGLASSLVGFMQMTLAVAASAVVGAFYDRTAVSLTVVVAACTLVAAMTYAALSIRRPARRLASGTTAG